MSALVITELLTSQFHRDHTLGLTMELSDGTSHSVRFRIPHNPSELKLAFDIAIETLTEAFNTRQSAPSPRATIHLTKKDSK